MNERQIFESALDIADPARRAVFLANACGPNQALLARVEALLAKNAAQSQFLETPVVQQLLPPSASDVVNTVHAPPGFVAEDESDVESPQSLDLSFLLPSTKPDSMGLLGHYEILQILGHGGFGVVFKAFDEKLHRHVAIKVMNPQMAATSPPRKRFLREARAAAAIRHENVVQVHNVEEHPLPYLVMEYIDGETLQQKQEEHGPLEVTELLHIGRQIASGLAAAHAQSLIHRDVKPGNILLEKGVERKVKITDFGLARAADDATLTRSGMISGTPMYMAPEQAMGQTLDHRSDLFSLGSVLYELATGRAPFRAPSTLAVLKRVVDDTPRPIQEIIPEIPDWLVTIINKLLSKKPDDRYQTATEVAELLARCQSELQLSGKVKFLPRGGRVSDRPSRESWFPARKLVGMLAVLAIIPIIWFSLAPRAKPPLGDSAIGANLAPRNPAGITDSDGPQFTAGQTAEASTPESPQPLVTDPDRAIAEWAISKGGNVQLNGQTGTINTMGDLPAEVFYVTSIAFPETAADCLTDADFARLRGGQKLATLYVVGPQSRITDQGFKQLADVIPPSLTTVAFYGSLPNITDAVVTDLNRMIYVKTLHLEVPQLTNAAIEQLRVPSLVDLGLANSKATLLGLNDAKDRLPGLQIVVIEGTSIPAIELSILSQWNLNTLILIDVGIRDQDLPLLHSQTSLERLELRGNSGITDEGLPHLLALRNLRFLDLDGTGVTDAGIVNLKGLPELSGLHANNLRLTDAGIGSISELPKLESLRIIGSKAITDIALEHLATCSTLKYLEIQECPGLTEAGVRKLRQAMPELQIRSDYPNTAEAEH